MGGLAERLGDILQSHPEQAGLVIGLLVFAESLAFVGFFVPSTALLLAIGVLVGTGVVDPGPVLIFAVVGAVAGDAISYELGRWMGPAALRTPAIRKHRRAIARARLFGHRAGVLAMILGRFTGPARSFVPLVGGMLRMGRARFQFANLVGAVLWIPIMLAPGVLAARGLTLLPAGMVEPVIISLAIIGLAVMAWRWGRRRT